MGINITLSPMGETKRQRNGTRCDSCATAGSPPRRPYAVSSSCSPVWNSAGGWGSHEIVPVEEPPGHRGDQQRASLEKIHYQWRRHVFIRFNVIPHGCRSLTLELEHQQALRRADYFEEPRSGYFMKLGYRFF